MPISSKGISPYAVGLLLVTGLIGVFLVPYQIAVLIDGWGMSAAASGVLGMLELAAMSLASMLILSMARQVSLPRLALFGLMAAIAGEVSTSFFSSLWVLGFARALTGIGCGTVLAVSSTYVALAANPNRVMGLGLTLASLLFFAAFLITPRLLLTIGPRGLFLGLALCVAASAVTLPHLSGLSVSSKRTAAGGVRSTLDQPKVAALSLALVSLNVGLGAMWSFAERIGREIGLSPDQTSIILAACSIAMIAGSAVAGLMGHRFGNRWPLLVASIACGVACYGATLSVGFFSYAAALMVFNFCYLFLGPFALAGVPSILDPSGRLAATANGLMWLAYSAGVAAGGLIAEHTSVKAIGAFALCGCAVAALGFYYATAQTDSQE